MDKENVVNVTGIVSSVRKDGKGFKLDNGSWYSGFTALPVAVGQKVSFGYVQNGDFKNVSGPISSSGGGSTSFYAADDSSKTASMLLSYAKDIYIAGLGKSNLKLENISLDIVDAYKLIKEKLK